MFSARNVYNYQESLDSIHASPTDASSSATSSSCRSQPFKLKSSIRNNPYLKLELEDVLSQAIVKHQVEEIHRGVWKKEISGDSDSEVGSLTDLERMFEAEIVRPANLEMFDLVPEIPSTWQRRRSYQQLAKQGHGPGEL